MRWICAAMALALLAPATAAAERAAGISGNLNLVRFDTAAPGEAQVRLITGLETSGEKAIGLDTRPATGELFLVTTPVGVMSGSSVITRSYRLDPETALATFVAALAGGVVPGAGDWQTGVDFNPVVDRLRLVNASNENYRINPNSGLLTGNDSNLTFTAPATGPVTAVAYDRNVAPGPPGTIAPPGTLTTLYGVDVGSDRLSVQGGINGAGPGGANGGAITPIGRSAWSSTTAATWLPHLAWRHRVCRPARRRRAAASTSSTSRPGKRPRSACGPLSSAGGRSVRLLRLLLPSVTPTATG